MLQKYQKEIASYYLDQKKIVEEEKLRRQDLRVRYRREAQIKKYKYRMQERHQTRSVGEVRTFLRKYADYFLNKRVTDDVLYDYQKKLITTAQMGVV